MRVQIIGDNQQGVRNLTYCLKMRFPKINVVSVAEGLRGIELVEKELPEMVIVNSPLPDIDTGELVRKIRTFSEVALIVIRKAEGDIDGVKALEAGADEFVTRPFTTQEFLAKVKALLRRTQRAGPERGRVVFLSDELVINFDTCQVLLSGRQVQLTRVECNLLFELVRNERKVLANSILVEKIWGPEPKKKPDLVKKYIHRLRSKLESDSRNPQMLLTERGRGYKFVKPV